MPNRTVYINDANFTYFKNEKDKSKLVNGLLSDHYGILTKERLRGSMSTLTASGVEFNNPTEMLKAMVDVTLEQFCPNGHRLTDGGRCIRRACQHAER